ncbi:hypothetical protein E2I00_003021 [Balaenoptera physalus]|uniref:Uncharacterized protein n=1 Tax=Balaenoptera physalus TaxID=9770 RepID=A0A6A1QL69_BALPH|nr:hypothetical protein E2I00_003021 [Balaenoptera physalus]
MVVAEVELNMMTRVQKAPFVTGNVYRRTELKEEIEVIKQQFQNLEDACDDITLPDDYLMTPYPIGDAFTSHFQEETPQMVEEKFAREK